MASNWFWNSFPRNSFMLQQYCISNIRTSSRTSCKFHAIDVFLARSRNTIYCIEVLLLLLSGTILRIMPRELWHSLPQNVSIMQSGAVVSDGYWYATQPAKKPKPTSVHDPAHCILHARLSSTKRSPTTYKLINLLVSLRVQHVQVCRANESDCDGLRASPDEVHCGWRPYDFRTVRMRRASAVFQWCLRSGLKITVPCCLSNVVLYLSPHSLFVTDEPLSAIVQNTEGAEVRFTIGKQEGATMTWQEFHDTLSQDLAAQNYIKTESECMGVLGDRMILKTGRVNKEGELYHEVFSLLTLNEEGKITMLEAFSDLKAANLMASAEK